jgi:hypothetical protein
MPRRIQIAVAAALLLALAPMATPAVAAPSGGWFWTSDPYFYSVNANSLVYITTVGETVWFYDYASATWAEDPGWVNEWVWIDWPWVYRAGTGSWQWATTPNFGVWMFVLNTQQWVQL